MTFEETWNYLMGPDNEDAGLKKFALAFFVAGETRGVENCQQIVTIAHAPEGAPQ